LVPLALVAGQGSRAEDRQGGSDETKYGHALINPAPRQIPPIFFAIWKIRNPAGDGVVRCLNF
jgi:hypothetical protein